MTHFVEHQHSGAQFEGFGNIVRDHEYGHRQFLPEPQQQFVHICTDAGIKRTEGLVQQQNFRPFQQRLGNGKPLLHPAGQLRGIPVLRGKQANFVQRFRHSVARMRP